MGTRWDRNMSHSLRIILALVLIASATELPADKAVHYMHSMVKAASSIEEAETNLEMQEKVVEKLVAHLNHPDTKKHPQHIQREHKCEVITGDNTKFADQLMAEYDKEEHRGKGHYHKDHSDKSKRKIAEHVAKSPKFHRIVSCLIGVVWHLDGHLDVQVKKEEEAVATDTIKHDAAHKAKLEADQAKFEKMNNLGEKWEFNGEKCDHMNEAMHRLGELMGNDQARISDSHVVIFKGHHRRPSFSRNSVGGESGKGTQAAAPAAAAAKGDGTNPYPARLNAHVPHARKEQHASNGPMGSNDLAVPPPSTGSNARAPREMNADSMTGTIGAQPLDHAREELNQHRHHAEPHHQRFAADTMGVEKVEVAMGKNDPLRVKPPNDLDNGAVGQQKNNFDGTNTDINEPLRYEPTEKMGAFVEDTVWPSFDNVGEAKADRMNELSDSLNENQPPPAHPPPNLHRADPFGSQMEPPQDANERAGPDSEDEEEKKPPQV